MAEPTATLPPVEPRSDLTVDEPPPRPPSAPPGDDRYGGGGGPPYRGGQPDRSYTPGAAAGRVYGDGIDKDIAGMARLALVIKELRTQDETYVSIFRIEPAHHPITRKPIRGYKMRWPVSEFRGPEDLIERIRHEYGGNKWDVRFSVPEGKDSGSLRYYKSIRVEIDAEPISEGQNGQSTVISGQNGQPTVISQPAPPDVNADLVKGTLGVLTQQISDMKRDSGGSRTETMGLVRDIFDMAQKGNGGPAAATAVADGFKEALRVAESRAQDAQKEVSELRKIMLQPQQGTTSDALRAVTETTSLQVGAAHKEAAAAVERARSDHERELKVLSDRHERDIQAERDRHSSERGLDKERHKAETERSHDQLKDMTKRMEDQSKDSRREMERVSERLSEVERKASEERTKLLENHSSEMRHLQSAHKAEVDSMTRRLDDERTQTERLRLNYEDRIKAEVSAARETAGATIAGLNERIKLAEERANGAERRGEERVRDLEKTRDDLMRQLMDEKSRRPDPMSSVSGLASTAKELAGAFGYSRDQPSAPSAPQRSETADLLVAAKEAGIVDGIKGIGSQIIGAVAAGRAAAAAAQQPQPQQPPWVIPVARDPVTGYPILPSPAAAHLAPPQPMYYQPPQPAPIAPGARMAPPPPLQPPPGFAQSPASPFAAYQGVPTAPPPGAFAQPPPQASQPQPAAPPAGPTPDADAVLAMIIPAVGQEFEAGKSASDLAKEMMGMLPPIMVKHYVEGGVSAFMDIIANTAPESPLLNAKGEKYLRDVFGTLRSLLK